MHLFSDYLQPLTTWIYTNPHWALIITFFISFSESLAIIGSIIPGSVTMTAIGILAGSGVMRIDLTLIAATLGAIAGDGVSYVLGYTFRHRLTEIWPFKRYPHWLDYGKSYFARHGGKSVLIGRFIGPLRSIIPVIAGMMHMNRWHFLLANVLSAIGWSIVYVMPGVLIGAASTELSAENASRLFIIILIILASFWLLTLCIKWLLKHLYFILRIHLHRFWIWSKQHPYLSFFIQKLTPAHESHYYPTAALMLVWFTCLILSFVFIGLTLQAHFFMGFNEPVYLFLQSLRTPAFDAFFIGASLFIHPLVLLTLWSIISLYACFYKHWRLLQYWLSLGATCIFITIVLVFLIHCPEPKPLLLHSGLFQDASGNLMVQTSFISFLLFYLSASYRSMLILWLRMLFLAVLFLSGISSIYLGINWFSNVLSAYLTGLTISIAYWISYRRIPHVVHYKILPIILTCLLFFTLVMFAYWNHYKTLIQMYRPYYKQYVVTDTRWWSQKTPLLPIYTTNRIGHRTGVFNIQYAGAINLFEQALTAYGWKKQSSSLLHSLLIRAAGKKSEEDLPLLAQLYQNKKPALVMTYIAEKNQSIWVLRLWRSNFHLRHYQQPVWLGSVHIQTPRKQQKKSARTLLTINQQYPFRYILPALERFQIKRIPLENETKLISDLPFAVKPELLLIKSPSK